MKKGDFGFEMLHDEMCLVWNNDKKMVDYCCQTTSNVVPIDNDRFVIIKKEGHIYTTMYVGEGYCAGRTFEEAQDICANMNKNKWNAFYHYNMDMSPYRDDFMEHLDSPDYQMVGLIQYHGGKNGIGYNVRKKWEPLQNGWFVLPDEVREQVVKCEKANRDRYIKRLETYFKKYPEKIHAESYWADR